MIPSNAKFKAHLECGMVDYYFDENMEELGFVVSGKFHDSTKGRKWGAGVINSYIVYEMNGGTWRLI